MNRRILALVAAVVLGTASASAATGLACGSVPEYRELLQQVDAAITQPAADLHGIADTIPEACALSTSDAKLQFSNAALRKDIEDIVRQPEPRHRAELVEKLHSSLQKKLTGLAEFERGKDPAVDGKLHSILARKEFSQVSGQDVSALVQEQLMKLVLRFLSLITKNPEQALQFIKIALGLVCAVIFALLMYWGYRWASRRGADLPAREYMAFAPSAKDWRQWIAEARLASERGDYREAVHLGYWAAISRLESSGAWRPDKARTPREYLHLLRKSDASWTVLLEITKQFEVIWYGNHIPVVSECEQFFARVEQLGCR